MRTENKDGVLVIYLEGHLLGAQASAGIMALVLQSIEAANKKVVFNMAGVNYIDSSGLGTLLSSSSKIKNAGGALVIAAFRNKW